ncbi:MAG: acetyl-CoA carboxylase biotin carboxylase subunit [Phycisphaeraceae bacterium]|nr:acetyl-CoA carboxylase biotin carboxylase subunit [Phycisphaerales bacterium]MCB9843526.1 acetyl-CoA carboxylase biotin carboxylase subunit [Phycisphaeraceae bacterium]
MFKRVLIANRGEIALRIIRACHELGIEAVAVYSEADAGAPYLRMADHAVCIGKGPASDSYLNIPHIIAAAEITDADAIHPGYGFLAENAHFASVCRDCKMEFIGPSPEAMALLGDKISCKAMARKAKVPTFPGTEGAIDDIEEAVGVAFKIGYPVIIKAAAGGGGRGMRVCRNEDDLRAGVKKASQEAQAAFANGAVYIEKFLEHARHVEVQVIGDKHGNAIHLYERDCSVQRRHQKLIEEAPAPGVDSRKREDLCKSAARLVKNAEYSGAATVEFLMDEKQNFYLLEVNTRVQVEHPITEMITGVDIVKTGIRVAAGEPLPYRQKDITIRGHSIECRINAEDPKRNFAPCAGTVERFDPPGGPGVRMDTHVISGYRVPPNYDSMIGKLIVHADDRAQAIARASRALKEFRVEPIATTIPLHIELMANKSFQKGGVDIHFLERLLKSQTT